MKRKLLTSIVGCAMAIVIGLSAVGCIKGEAQAQSFVSLDINPSIELTLDKNDKVISAYGANEDGQVLLYGEASIVGLNVEDAVEKITQLAVKYGFINEDNTVIGTSVSSKTDELADKLLSKINTKVVATATTSGISVTTDGEGSWSLVRKFNKFKQEHPELADLTIAEFKLAVSASQTGEITLEAAVKLDDSALIKIINDARKNVKEYTTKAYEKIRVEAEETYDELVGLAMNSVYIKYRAEDEDGTVSGLTYNEYNLAATLLDNTADKLALAQDIGQNLQGVDLTPLANAAAELTGASLDQLKDSDGKVTLESIYAYIDLLYKNGDITDKDIENIEVYIGQAETVVVQAIEQLVNEAINEILERIDFSKYVSISGVDFSDGLTVEEIYNLADFAREYADAYLKRLEAALDKDELQEINEKKEEIKSTIDGAKTILENKLNNAKEQAQTKLNNLKNALKEKQAA